MARSKQYLYPANDQITSSFAKALGHTARLMILRQLQSEGPLCVQVIAEKHPISKEALSDHLKILRDAQLVEWVERFPYTFYSIHIKNMEKAFQCMDSFFRFFQLNT